MSLKTIRARSTTKANARALAGLPATRTRGNATGISPTELEAILGDMYKAPSLNGLDLIE